MRVALLLAVILALGSLGPANAQCVFKNVDTAVCQKLNDVESIDSRNLTNLKAPVFEKTLRSISLKNLPTSMKSLDLSAGDIEVVEPGAFLNAMGLVDLKMSDNHIAQLKDSALDGLLGLKNFDLRRNNIRQLPLALTKLKALKNLELSGNPLICNCDTLRVRDEILANAVKISKKVFCMTPAHLKGVSLLEPEAEVICMFEDQDKDMQADEAAGSGDGEEEPLDGIGELTDVPPVVDEADNAPEIITDDLIIPVMSRSGLEATPDNSSASSDADSSGSTATKTDADSPTDSEDFVFSPFDEDHRDDLIVEGSGTTEPEEEGSGVEGSGIWAVSPVDSLPEVSEATTSTTEEPTTASHSWYDVFWTALGGDSSTTPPNSNQDVETGLDGEEFITVSSAETTTALPGDVDAVEEEVVTKKADILDNAVPPGINSKSGNGIEDFADPDENEDLSVGDVKAATGVAKKSMGSYVVLAALLGVLGGLVGFAAYKSSICKKKSNDDPERGTELKDIQKALLDPNNTNQPKIAANGNTENAPLVEPSDEPWAGPQEMRQWTDQNPPTVDNGAKYTPPVAESDPVKPPRKSLPPQDEPNGLQEVKTQSPMSTFSPRSNGAQPQSVTPPNSPSSVSEEENHSPPLSPNTQRVKITMQENPDSVPKTPILITRTKPGVNLVKTP